MKIMALCDSASTLLSSRFSDSRISRLNNVVVLELYMLRNGYMVEMKRFLGLMMMEEAGLGAASETKPKADIK